MHPTASASSHDFNQLLKEFSVVSTPLPDFSLPLADGLLPYETSVNIGISAADFYQGVKERLEGNDFVAYQLTSAFSAKLAELAYQDVRNKS